jgi:putative oxygen-independent coproporphyrinogen III oxidase
MTQLLERAIAGGDRTGRWLAEPGLGVYVHIPFCLHRCHYCDFNTYENLDALHADYVDALLREIRDSAAAAAAPPWGVATSVFFGGGTPTLLPVDALARLLGAVRDSVGIAADAEVTIECNPETVGEATFEALLEAGYNRFSVGIQSLDPLVLDRLGRVHSVDVATAAVHAARAAGVADLNIDLIYGSPFETDGSWERTLAAAVELGPDHVSAYSLMVEPGTPLATFVATGRERDVDPDVQADRYARADQVLAAAGFARYEISNWARAGRASRHNLLYWSAGDYLAWGAGAHGHVAGHRWWRTRLPRDYIDQVESGSSTISGDERLGSLERADEALMVGLRVASGIDRAAFEARFGRDPVAGREGAAAALVEAGLLTCAGGRVAIAPSALFVAHEVISRLL